MCTLHNAWGLCITYSHTKILEYIIRCDVSLVIQKSCCLFCTTEHILRNISACCLLCLYSITAVTVLSLPSPDLCWVLHLSFHIWIQISIFKFRLSIVAMGQLLAWSLITTSIVTFSDSPTNGPYCLCPKDVLCVMC